MRMLLACCLILIGATAGFAENDSKSFVEGCNDRSLDGLRSYDMGQCIGVISTLMVVGPYLDQVTRFCPPAGRAIYGMGAMNKYTKAHPEVLKPDAPHMDRLVMLIMAFREEWPCNKP
jgi:hypothetical protein